MKSPVFTGVATAIVTPFTENGINHPLLYRLIDRQIEAGIDGIVLCGTTGEASTMTESEQLEVIRKGCEYIDGRTVVIAGTGSNGTAHAVSMTEHACAFGIDAVLIVTPYYNKATENGLIRHYERIADCSSVPVIAYNVPSRTGVNMSLSVYEQLAKHPNINGVKEASGDIAKVSRIVGTLGNDFYVWSGNDDQNVAITALGGKGAISVLSNVCPKEAGSMVHSALNGKIFEAADLQNQMMPLIDALFCEVNPIPVKEALVMMGYDTSLLRLPLCSMTKQHRERLRGILKQYKLIF
ncbi:MAG: 4-hydroxy-tetrahydrodipicolinate synthase [Oscillospiraceae bacterium]|nr:4-hydroxy-tetrahydrodipicolinate synthase [Oscillospiraceae bacterium]